MRTTRTDRDMKRFLEHFLASDDLALYVLKGHLLVEEYLGRIVELSVRHPEFLERARLQFFQKIELARAFSIRDQDSRIWKLAFALNALRNELAHSLDRPKLSPKLEALRTVYFEIYPEERTHAITDEVIVRDAVLTTMGFLGECEAETADTRVMNDSLIEGLKRIEARLSDPTRDSGSSFIRQELD